MDILVCLEGSASTASAMKLAFAIARAQRASLVGLAIVDEPDILAGAATSIGGTSYRKDRDAAMLDDAHAHARDWLDTFVQRGRGGRRGSRSVPPSSPAAPPR